MNLLDLRNQLTASERQAKYAQNYVDIVNKARAGDFAGFDKLLEKDERETRIEMSGLDPASDGMKFRYAGLQGILTYVVGIRKVLSDPEKALETLGTEIQKLDKAIKKAERRNAEQRMF